MSRRKINFFKVNTGLYSDISIKYNSNTGYLSFKDPVSGEWIDSYITLSEFAKVNALNTSVADWIKDGVGTVSLSTSSIQITHSGTHTAGVLGSYEYKNSVKLSKTQRLSINMTLGGSLPQNSMLYLYYRAENATSWTLLKMFDGSVDGYNITYTTLFPITENAYFRLAYGISGNNVPVNIKITKFTVE